MSDTNLKFTYPCDNGNEIVFNYRINDDDSEAIFCHFNDRVCHIDLIHSDLIGTGFGDIALQCFMAHIATTEGVFDFYLFASYDEGYFNKGRGKKRGLNRLVSFYERNGFDCLIEYSSGDDQVDMSQSFEFSDKQQTA